MDARAARRLLLAQHETIREHLARCRRLAQEARDGRTGTEELETALAQLRDAFFDHNLSESALIRPLLLGAARWGDQMLERMIEEHLAEHVAMWEVMGRPPRELVNSLGNLAEELDAHMAAEERTFLAILDPEVIDRHRA